MAIESATKRMTSAEVVALNRAHTFFSWSIQGALDPIAIDHAEGIYLYTPEGQRIIDFNSGLMSVNIGHGDRRVIDAITEQATKLQYVTPAFATEIRARLGQKLAEILPGDLDKVFFTLGGAEAIENAIKLARHHTGRHKVLARYRAYHGATFGAMTLTGDPRRWANEPGLVGVVRYPDTHRWGEKEPRPVEESLQGLEDVIRYEGAHTIAAVFLETIVGTNGILIPPDGYLQGVRDICTRNGILMVCDEVMAGFGRTGRWFAVDHWDVVPDLMTLAKGLTSSYLPLGAVAMRHEIAEAFESKMFYGGLTYSSHPISLAASLATIRVYEEDDLIGNSRRLGPVMRGHHERLAAKHPSVGAHRNIGLFGIIDLVRSQDPWTPLTPYNGTSDEMKAIGKFFRDNGLYTFAPNNSIHTNPPLCITEEQLAEGFDIIDRALDIADQAVS
ncbi:MAG: aminotransferase class III-fold pyridoxal phosphate-dependent enzyme [Chloroflexi bacterium]|nr:MAG: aminotransferase class III-fold pyridoxal phosphate-dependent enzyme [Chloroflexota bacterium]